MILIGLLRRQNHLWRLSSPSILRSIDTSRFFTTNQDQTSTRSILSVRLPVLVQQPNRTRKLKFSFGYTNYGHRRHIRPPGHHVVQYLHFFFIIIGVYALFYLTFEISFFLLNKQNFRLFRNVTEFDERWSQSAPGSDISEMNSYINSQETQRRLDIFSSVKAASVLPSADAATDDTSVDVNNKIDLSEVMI